MLYVTKLNKGIEDLQTENWVIKRGLRTEDCCQPQKCEMSAGSLESLLFCFTATDSLAIDLVLNREGHHYILSYALLRVSMK